MATVFYTLMASSLMVALFAISWPLISRLLAVHYGRGAPHSGASPRSVTVIISARNEADAISATLKDLRAATDIDMRVVVVSDGSTDETAVLAREASADTVIELAEPVGKTGALALALRHRRPEDIVVCLDSTTRIEPSSLSHLIASFADPTVAVASGLVIYDYSATPMGHGFRSYQRMVLSARVSDSHLFSNPSVSGALCAFRPDLWPSDVPSDLPADLLLPLWAAKTGRRAVLVSDAVCRERSRRDVAAVFHARLRMSLQAYGFMAYVWSRRKGLSWRYLLALLGQKVSRWILPLCLAVATLFGIFIWPKIVLAGALTCAASLGLARLPGGGLLFGPLSFAVVLGGAYVVGAMAYLLGQRAAIWDPSERKHGA